MEIINLIKEYREKIFRELSKDKKSFDDYKFIMAKFEGGNIANNDEFKKVYRRFYVLNVGGLGEKLIDRYFELLQRGEMDIKKILIELSKIPRLNGKPAVLLSFASKLIHTVDNDQPIYDSRVTKIFNIKLNDNIKDINEKIDDRLAAYDLLKRKFNEILVSQEIREIIKDFKERLKVNIGDVKTLDFILWKLGDIIMKQGV